jgi:hypothetical protein
MARRPGARVVMNREAVDALRLGWADGTQEEAEAIVATAAQRIPDVPPIGRGLKFSGAAVTYVDGKKVAGKGTAPRGAAPASGVVTILGFGFPGRFREVGTVRQPPRPTLTPAMTGRVQGGMRAIPLRLVKRLAKVRSR